MKETKESQRFKHTTKIANMITMFKTKWRKNKEKEPKPDTGGHDGPFCKSTQRSRNP
jgi:hypothetical protein